MCASHAMTTTTTATATTTTTAPTLANIVSTTASTPFRRPPSQPLPTNSQPIYPNINTNTNTNTNNPPGGRNTSLPRPTTASRKPLPPPSLNNTHLIPSNPGPSHPHLPSVASVAHSPSPLPSPPPPASAPRPHPSQSDPVLPRGSRVRITGNNRTKWDLIGRVGLVRAAQTLGGWHEVQLTDGGIVRVQRNALAVLELPTADPSSLVRIESARRENPVPLQPTVKKRLKKSHRPSHANISKLNVASLKRYRSVYKLNVSNDCSRDELVGAVRKHFERTKVNETEVISSFLRHIARRGGPPASD